jgi:hypothetical protein
MMIPRYMFLNIQNEKPNLMTELYNNLLSVFKSKIDFFDVVDVIEINLPLLMTDKLIGQYDVFSNLLIDIYNSNKYGSYDDIINKFIPLIITNANKFNSGYQFYYDSFEYCITVTKSC